MPYIQCKDCLEWQEGRCLRHINKDGCYGATVAVTCMRAAELREDPLPRKFLKKWWE